MFICEQNERQLVTDQNRNVHHSFIYKHSIKNEIHKIRNTHTYIIISKEEKIFVWIAASVIVFFILKILFTVCTALPVNFHSPLSTVYANKVSKNTEAHQYILKK